MTKTTRRFSADIPPYLRRCRSRVLSAAVHSENISIARDVLRLRSGKTPPHRQRPSRRPPKSPPGCYANAKHAVALTVTQAVKNVRRFITPSPSQRDGQDRAARMLPIAGARQGRRVIRRSEGFGSFLVAVFLLMTNSNGVGVRSGCRPAWCPENLVYEGGGAPFQVTEVDPYTTRPPPPISWPGKGRTCGALQPPRSPRRSRACASECLCRSISAVPGAGLRPTATAGVEDGQRADREEILLLAEKGGSMTGSGRAQGNAGATLSRGRRQRTLRQRALDDKR